MKLYLKEPTIKEKEEVIKMCEELKEVENMEKYEGFDKLEVVLKESYERWLEENEINKNIELENPELSNVTNYLLVDRKGHVYGNCSIRHHLKDNLLFVGGNVSYGIRPSERNKGYGATLFELILEKAKELGIKKILITCRDNNLGSKKIIEKYAGEPDISTPSKIEGIMELRYWIDLKNRE
jgi:predicted acetyltransferase